VRTRMRTKRSKGTLKKRDQRRSRQGKKFRQGGKRRSARVTHKVLSVPLKRLLGWEGASVGKKGGGGGVGGRVGGKCGVGEEGGGGGGGWATDLKTTCKREYNWPT